MPYITVDVNADEVLAELDHDDILDYMEYNIDEEDILRRLSEDNINQFLIDNGTFVLQDSNPIKDFLQKKDAYGLMNFIHKEYEEQIGAVYESVIN
jgi:hypothetical protein